jgi:hypothetical protein
MVSENSIASEEIVIQAPEELGVFLSLLRPPLKPGGPSPV